MAEKLNGLDLSISAAEIEEEIFRERKERVIAVLRGIYRDLDNWERTLKKRFEEIAQLEERIAKAKDKLQKIKLGDWTQVPSWDLPVKQETKDAG